MIYIIYADIMCAGYHGIMKKIKSQINVFRSYFGRVFYTSHTGQMIYLFMDDKIIDKELAVTRKMYNEVISNWISKYRIQRIYVRYNLANKWFIQFMRTQKERGMKLILEIPTYPYEGEIVDKKIRVEDEYYRKQLHQYLDYVATNSNEQTVLGMQCIRLLNGVDIEEHPICLKKKDKKEIVLIGVSSMAIWHGYERILEGLAKYYENSGEYNIYFKVVGDGEERKKYYSMTLKYGLQSKVEFLGMLDGEKLNEQYKLSDIAVSSLGLYKTGIQEVTPIKGAEYCARGIPFICGYRDMRFPENAEYIMKVSNSPEPVDIYKVIEFHENISKQQGYQKRMREYAQNHFTWKNVMYPIVELFK